MRGAPIKFRMEEFVEGMVHQRQNTLAVMKDVPTV